MINERISPLGKRTFTRKQRAVSVIGIGNDGCVSLQSQAVNAVAGAQVLVGGERQLDFFPQFSGERIVLKSGLLATLDRVAELAEENKVCILASGDPLFFGIGALVVRRIGATHVEFIPAPSSMQWAFARIGLNWDDARFLSFHGRSTEGFVGRLKRLSKVACFTDEENSPRNLACLMVEFGEAAWTAWVCENLGGPDERVREFSIDVLANRTDIASLNVLILVRNDPSWKQPPLISFFHEDAFAKRMPKSGLITKREVRTLSLAAMSIRPRSIIWDVGAGSGSIAVEAAMLASEGRVYAIEVDPKGVDICRENIRRHGVDNVHIVAGRAPEALAGIEAPDAVFVGGSKGSLDAIVEIVLGRLRSGGRIVVNAITLENISEAYKAFRTRGITPEVTLVNVSRGVPLARYLRYEALNPVHIFSATKPQVQGDSS